MYASINISKAKSGLSLCLLGKDASVFIILKLIFNTKTQVFYCCNTGVWGERFISEKKEIHSFAIHHYSVLCFS